MSGTLAKRAVTSITCYAQLGIIAGPPADGSNASTGTVRGMYSTVSTSAPCGRNTRKVSTGLRRSAGWAAAPVSLTGEAAV